MVVKRACLPSLHLSLAALCSSLVACGVDDSSGNLSSAASNSEANSGVTVAPASSPSSPTMGASLPTPTEPGASQVAPAATLDAAGLRTIAIQHNKSQIISRLTKAQFLNASASLLGLDPTPFIAQIPDIAPNAGYSNSGHAQSQPYDLVLAFDLVTRSMTDAVLDWSALSNRYGGCAELACIDTFISTFGERAFRRPLTSSELEAFAPIRDAALQEGLSYPETASLVVRAFLQAPEFLYLFEDVPLTDLQLASRLSFFLTDAPPDDELYAAAKGGTLNTPHVLEEQTNRLLLLHGDQFARAFVYDFFDLRKAHQRTADVDDVTVGLLIASLQDTFAQMIESDARLSALLTTRSFSAGPEVAAFLGLPQIDNQVTASQTAGFIGLITHPATLLAISNAYEGSMVSRGLFLAHQLMCIPPTPPPARAFNPSDVAGELPPNPTQRDEAEARLKDPNCLGCHIQFEPYAFALNHWAGDGRYNPDERLRDDGPVTTSLGELKFTSYQDFFELLTKSTQFQTCMTDHLLQYAVRHTNFDNVVADTVLASAKQGGVTDPTFSSLIRLIVQHPIFGNR
jgi:Protein of unknown function (DUF1592)/Protein of unknown function (DUF1588)/Protein of unknown function (DUF1595)